MVWASFACMAVILSCRRSSSGTGGSGGGSGGDVLSLWLLRKLTGFVAQLKIMLPLIEDGGSLRGLLEEVSDGCFVMGGVIR